MRVEKKLVAVNLETAMLAGAIASWTMLELRGTRCEAVIFPNFKNT